MGSASAIGVIVNPHARRSRGRAAEVVDTLERVVGDDGQVHECGDEETLDAALRALRDAGVSALAVGGGDGTYSYVMSRAEGVFGAEGIPPVALLRGGTMNTSAKGMGTPKGKPVQLLRALVEDLRAGRELLTTPRPLMRGGDRLGCLFGTGLVVRYLDEYYSRGRPYPTPWTALSTLTSLAGSAVVRGPLIRRMAAPERLVLEVDGEVFPATDYLTIAAGTVPEFGLGFAPFPRCLEDPTRFEMLAATVSPAGFLWDLYRMRTGPKGLSPDHGLTRMARRMVLRPTDGAEDIQVMFDGDVLRLPAPLTVSVGPTVDVIVGAE